MRLGKLNSIMCSNTEDRAVYQHGHQVNNASSRTVLPLVGTLVWLAGRTE